MLTLHQRRTHRRPVDGCYGCRLSSVQVATSPAVKQVESRERALSKDLAAYRSLRRQGYQPEHLAGSAQVEATATDRWDIEAPRLVRTLDKEGRAHIDEAAQVAATIPAEISRFAQEAS